MTFFLKTILKYLIFHEPFSKFYLLCLLCISLFLFLYCFDTVSRACPWNILSPSKQFFFFFFALCRLSSILSWYVLVNPHLNLSNAFVFASHQRNISLIWSATAISTSWDVFECLMTMTCGICNKTRKMTDICFTYTTSVCFFCKDDHSKNSLYLVGEGHTYIWL